MEFENEKILMWLLLPIALGIIFLWVLAKRKRLQNEFVDEPLQKYLFYQRSKAKTAIRYVLYLIGIALIIIGLANPLGASKETEVEQLGSDVIFAIDASNSMMAEDISPNRLEKAKKIVYDVVRKMKGDRMGLIVYAGGAYPVIPITTDYSSINLFLDNVTPDLPQIQGTDINNAIVLANKMFDKNQMQNKLVFLLTDGENHEKINASLENGILITVGLGTDNGAPIPIKFNNYINGYKRDEEGQLIETKRNELILRELASDNGGAYIDGNQADYAVNQMLKAMEEIDKAKLNSSVNNMRENLYFYPIIMALIFLCVEILLVSTKKAKSYESVS